MSMRKFSNPLRIRGYSSVLLLNASPLEIPTALFSECVSEVISHVPWAGFCAGKWYVFNIDFSQCDWCCTIWNGRSIMRRKGPIYACAYCVRRIVHKSYLSSNYTWADCSLRHVAPSHGTNVKCNGRTKIPECTYEMVAKNFSVFLILLIYHYIDRHFCWHMIVNFNGIELIYRRLNRINFKWLKMNMEYWKWTGIYKTIYIFIYNLYVTNDSYLLLYFK